MQIKKYFSPCEHHNKTIMTVSITNNEIIEKEEEIVIKENDMNINYYKNLYYYYFTY